MASAAELCFGAVTALLILCTMLGGCAGAERSSKIQISCPWISVDRSGSGNFTSIQAAINYVPANNAKWMCIRIKAGEYREQVNIPRDKQYIYLEGDAKGTTTVVWDAHESIATSATFAAHADNLIVNALTFINSYNYPLNSSGNPMKPAVAALIEGDKSAFYGCKFVGFQDTLWDVQGRHYFEYCSIQGAVDFIFGAGQSIYEKCRISVVAGALNGVSGYITAQGRSQPNQTNGFVFKNCDVVGDGKTFLGRPWRDYARVIFYQTNMADIIVPQGWDAWFTAGHEERVSFDETGCTGLGANRASRVGWANKMTQREVEQFASISYIDGQSWL